MVPIPTTRDVLLGDHTVCNGHTQTTVARGAARRSCFLGPFGRGLIDTVSQDEVALRTASGSVPGGLLTAEIGSSWNPSSTLPELPPHPSKPNLDKPEVEDNPLTCKQLLDSRRAIGPSLLYD